MFIGGGSFFLFIPISRLSGCCITVQSCSSLISALHSNPTHLTELDLNYNHLGLSEFTQFCSVKGKLKTR